MFLFYASLSLCSVQTSRVTTTKETWVPKRKQKIKKGQTLIELNMVLKRVKQLGTQYGKGNWQWKEREIQEFWKNYQKLQQENLKLCLDFGFPKGGCN